MAVARMTILPVGATAVPLVTGSTGLAGPSGSAPSRFRSFVERYVIARATFFRVGQEKEDAWVAMLDAEAIYKRVGARAWKYVDDGVE